MPGNGGVTGVAADKTNLRVLPIQLGGHVQDNDTPGPRQALSDGAANPLRRASHDKRWSGAHGCPPRVAELSRAVIMTVISQGTQSRLIRGARPRSFREVLEIHSRQGVTGFVTIRYRRSSRFERT
jgi:hypothetical protein